MNIAVLLPSLKKKGPVILAFEIIKKLINRVEKIDVYYFSDCKDPYYPEDLVNVNYIKLSFFKSYDFCSYDILHTHSFKPDFYSFIFRYFIKCKIITTVHNYVYEELFYTYNIFVSKIFSRLWILTWSNKDSIVFLSNNMKEYYDGNGISNNKKNVIYNGRNISSDELLYSNSKEYHLMVELKKRYTIIGSCGVLNKRKGFDDLLRLLSINSELLAVFIGQGSEKDNLINEARNLNVLDRCVFLGHQNNSIALISLFDIFVMSSYSEGFPLVVLEAGGVGVPILCVNTPLFRELFSERDIVFYDRKNLVSMATSLNYILTNKNHFSENINKTIIKNYSCEIMGEKYYNLFKSVIL